MFIYGMSIAYSSWLLYRCDADEFCNLDYLDSTTSNTQQTRHMLGQSVRVYSTVDLVYGIVVPNPEPTGLSVAELAKARHLWLAARLSMPIDVLLALPWWNILTVVYPQVVAAVSRLQRRFLEAGLFLADPTAVEGFRVTESGRDAPNHHHRPGDQPLPKKLMTAIKRTPVARTIAAVHRVRTLPPPPRIIAPLLEEYLMPLVMARSFGTGHMAMIRLVSALPRIGDALWEAQLAQNFICHFVVSAKMLVLLVSSLRAAYTSRRLRARQRLVQEQIAARRVAKHARRFLVRLEINRLRRKSVHARLVRKQK